MAVLLGAVAALPMAAAAQSVAELPGITLTIDPVGEAGISGLAILSPRQDGTAANVLAVGAPKGTTAVIHAGACDAIDPAPVGLLGDVGAAGQLSTMVPVSYGVVADGRHIVAFHPGLDLATTLGCGQIPAVAGPSQGSKSPDGSTRQPGSWVPLRKPHSWLQHRVGSALDSIGTG